MGEAPCSPHQHWHQLPHASVHAAEDDRRGPAPLAMPLSPPPNGLCCNLHGRRKERPHSATTNSSIASRRGGEWPNYKILAVSVPWFPAQGRIDNLKNRPTLRMRPMVRRTISLQDWHVTLLQISDEWQPWEKGLQREKARQRSPKITWEAQDQTRSCIQWLGGWWVELLDMKEEIFHPVACLSSYSTVYIHRN